MEASQIYILISVIILLAIFVFMFFVKKNDKQKQLTPLTGLAFAFVVAGIVFGDNRLVGYSLMGVGILLAVVDIFLKRKS